MPEYGNRAGDNVTATELVSTLMNETVSFGKVPQKLSSLK